MKTIIVTILMSFILTLNTGYSQTFGWAKSIGGDTYDTERGYAIDKDGASKTYAIGSFNGTITLGSFTLSGTNDIYIVKYNLSGAVQWAVKAGGPGMDIGYDIACDNSGNSYITGYYTGTATFGSYNLTSISGIDIFIAKYNSSGDCIWAKSEGGDFSEKGKKIAVDNSGNIYIGGEFANEMTIGTTTLIGSIANIDIFMAKYTSSGGFLWAVSGGGNTNDNCTGIAVDASGNVYLNCFIRGTVHFSYNTFFPNTLDDNCVYVKYSSSGSFVWGYKESFSDISASTGISVDANSNCYTLCTNGIKKHDTFGGIVWEKQFITNNIISARGLRTDIFGNSYICGYLKGTTNFPPYSISNNNADLDIFVAKYDTDGNIEWVISTGSSGDDRAFDITSDLLGNVFITGDYSGTVNFGSITLNSLGIKDAFAAKINPQLNLITGKVFFDYNNNGIYDNATENGFSNILVSISPGTLNVNSNTSGNFSLFCGSGSHSVYIPYPLYYTSNPASRSVDFSGYGNINENNDFGLYPTPGINDLRVTLTALAAARPGFNTTQVLTYKNVGTTTLSGTISLLFDNTMNIISSSPGVIDITANPVTWNYSNISPNEERRILIEYNLPASVPLGTILTSTATINPVSGDYSPADNVYNLNQIVRGSYDPNDKSVEPSSNLTLQNIQDEDSLTYTIRFQNTGTDTAFTVKVTDTLSSKLNIPSVETVSSSHDYEFSIKNGNILIWTFNNILLPDSTTNEVKSHGFVKYRIKPKNNLSEGDVINNSANIYFDFNVPVITNTTVTRVGTTVKYLDLGFRLEAMYPHPDSIKVYLAKSVSPFEIIDTSTVFSQLNGPQFRAVPSFRNAAAGTSYYIIIKHRNSIETWSANPVVFNPDTTAYDFTTALSKAFGNNMVIVNNEASIYTGETEDDGLIDMSDVIRIYNDAIVFTTGDAVTDLNGDDLIDLSDMLYANNNAAKFVIILKP